MATYHGLNELREMFLSYFESKGHLRLPSFSLIPQNDKSLLLINSGMAPMKPYFKGEVEPPRRRICTCQKCIRTGDIENVGKDGRHGTYFEMLGNFSFGDYFKKEAIHWSWEFLTQVCGLEADRLYPSIYENDEEAFEIWNKQEGIPAERIYRFGKADNFWEHGSGPCGPCSEIYYDRGEKYGCGKPDCTVGCDCDRYVEIWNNVFSQFDNDGHGNYSDLAQKNIDTGMGLERLAVACQGVDSLFDVDTVMNITRRVTALTGACYGQSHKTDVSLRVITDHIRSAVFMIADGVLPSNEGRGYVLRRLLRRAARHGKLLGVDKPFLFDVVDTVVHENEGHYPYLRERQSFITKVIKSEEETFLKTLDGGLKIFSEMLEAHKAAGETVFSGEDAFKLSDTYGFPLDLSVDMAEEAGMSVDQEGFKKLLQEQKVRAREARKKLGDLAWEGIELGLDNTPTEFIGYEKDEDNAKVLAVVVDGEVSGAIAGGEDGILVLDKTPFYAEMGGQVADQGTITAGDAVFAVRNVLKDKGGKYLHHGRLVSGEIKTDDAVHASIDTARRQAIRRAHSATHLLQKALETVLGDHCHQAGSLVEPDHLRFDFTHFSAMSSEELAEVNRRVTELVLAGYPVETMVLPIAEAQKLGATALFGEKYGDVVRVVRMGPSLEFCGGTHLDNTAKVGLFRICSEGSVASGVRRIEAITGPALLEELDRLQGSLNQTAEVLKTSPGELLRKAEATVNELRELRQQLEAMKDRMHAGELQQLLASGQEVKGLRVLSALREGMDAAELRKFGDLLRDKDPNVVGVLASEHEGKISVLAVCGANAVKQGVKAGVLVKTILAACGGSGGGKPDSAMGGCKDMEALKKELEKLPTYIE